MRIATSTNLVSFRPEGKKTPITDLLPLYGKEGFNLLDLNWCEMMNPSSELCGDHWLEYVRKIQEEKEQYHLSFNQSHAPYDRHIGEHHYDRMILRCFDIDALLGVPLLVIHPLASDHDPVEENLSYLAPFVEKSEECGIRIALENLEGTGEIRHAEELLALVERLGSGNVGVCLDTGHAWMNGLDLPGEIHTYGERLWATHIADNHGKEDEHLLPFHGTIDWHSVVTALGEIGYQGDLTFECMKENSRIPSSLRGSAIAYALAVGKALLEM